MAEAQNEIATSFQIIDMARDLDFPLTRWQEFVIIRHGEARYAQQERRRQDPERPGFRDEWKP